MTENGEHEGYAAYVAPDGRTGGTSSGAGVLIRRDDADAVAQAAWDQGRPPTHEDLYDLVPWDDVRGWQVVCGCDWTGSTWDRAATLPGKSRIPDPETAYLPDGTTVEEAAIAEWRQHITDAGVLDELEDAARKAGEAGRRLDAAVAAARASGASWSQIGRATGMTRQSAHERWSRQDDVRSQ